jgi:hypothetical protein
LQPGIEPQDLVQCGVGLHLQGAAGEAGEGTEALRPGGIADGNRAGADARRL